MSRRKTVGVLGGMGPAATVEFFRRLVIATPARVDQEHLHILIDNNPHVPDRTEAIFRHGPSPEPALVDMARRLQDAGAELLVMPCNTAHTALPAIRRAVAIPVLDMIALTADRIGPKRVGLLATAGTIQLGLYQQACAERDAEVIVPDSTGQRVVTDAIRAIKAGQSLDDIESALAELSSELGRAGAEAIIAGCTEISLVDGRKMPFAWIDALDCLVEATILAAIPAAESTG
jgi:aspartate racemase